MQIKDGNKAPDKEDMYENLFDLLHDRYFLFFDQDENLLRMVNFKNGFDFIKEKPKKTKRYMFTPEKRSSYEEVILPKIEILYLAGIFHDLGKGKGGDHSEIGEKIVTKFCKRLSFSIHDTKLLGWLVRNHLIMSSISQKTDVHDPQTIKDFTKIVNSIEKLNYIYILTINDIRGTNPTLWNSWKHDLLKELFLSSRRKLNFEDQESHKLIIAERKNDSLEGIEQKALPDAEAIWAQLPNTYFSKYQIEQLQNQALVVANANFQTTASVFKRKNLLEIFIFTPNQEGLFFKTAKALESLSLETIDANIHTTNYGVFALNTFICKHKVLGSNLTKRDELGIQQKIISKLTSETKPKEKQSIAKLKKVFEHTTRVEITALLNPSSNLVTSLRILSMTARTPSVTNRRPYFSIRTIVASKRSISSIAGIDACKDFDIKWSQSCFNKHEATTRLTSGQDTTLRN